MGNVIPFRRFFERRVSVNRPEELPAQRRARFLRSSLDDWMALGAAGCLRVSHRELSVWVKSSEPHHLEVCAGLYPLSLPTYSDAIAEDLHRVGFTPTSAGVASRVFDARKVNALGNVVLCLTEALASFGLDASAPVASEQSVGAKDLRVRRAMRAVSRFQAPESRQQLYHSLANALFEVAVDDSVPDWALPPLHAVDELQGFPVYAVFTDPPAFCSWDAPGKKSMTVPGIALFPILAQRKIGAVKVNPNSDVSGELYRNEVEALASALQI